MASIKTVAQDMLDVARDGIGWIALWKEGRAWSAMSFWPDYNERTHRMEGIDEFERVQLQAIADMDPEAVIVNGYTHNLGDPDTMSRDSLAEALRWQYGIQSNTVRDMLLAIG